MKIAQRYFSVLLLAALFVGTTTVTSAEEVRSNTSRPGMADMLENVTPAVVNIAVNGHIDSPQNQNPLSNDPLFRQFFGIPEQAQPQQRQFQSAGSGVIIDADKGYVITNHHVIDHADEISVTLFDKRSFTAKLIGSDAATDVALLQIEADNLVEVGISDSDTLRVGDLVMAIGNPFGLGQTVTTGMVGALGRNGINREGFEDFIQTDASINPGNSGGALIDYNGELVGINTAIIAPSGGNVGIGFAVPTNMAMAVVDQLLEYGEIRRGMIGISIADLTPDVASALDLSVTEGAIIQSVQPDSAASEAGLEAGDVVISVGGESVSDMSDLRNKLALVRAGTAVDLEVLREQQRLKLSVTPSESNPFTAGQAAPAQHQLLAGVQLGQIPSDHRAYNKVRGVLVIDVAQDSRAWRNQLRPGDIITAVNRNPVASPGELEERMAAARGAVALSVIRDDQRLLLILR